MCAYNSLHACTNVTIAHMCFTFSLLSSFSDKQALTCMIVRQVSPCLDSDSFGCSRGCHCKRGSLYYSMSTNLGHSLASTLSLFLGGQIFPEIISCLTQSLISVSFGASINDVRKMFGFFDPLPPLSANSRNLPY